MIKPCVHNIELPCLDTRTGECLGEQQWENVFPYRKLIASSLPFCPFFLYVKEWFKNERIENKEIKNFISTNENKSCHIKAYNTAFAYKLACKIFCKKQIKIKEIK